jgi:hypothetical protein
MAASPPPRPPTDASSLADAMGGTRGVAESSIPPAAFVIAYTATGQDAELSAVLALVAAGLLTVARLVRGETLRYAMAGLFGVGLAAFVVSRSGRAEDFFLPGLLLNAAYAGGYLLSIVIRRPLVGVLVAAIMQRRGWREDPVQLRAFTLASWVWVGLFSLRLAVQLPLYLAGATVPLGVARVAMGLPLFAIGVWLTWLVIRETPVVKGEPAPA